MSTPQSVLMRLCFCVSDDRHRVKLHPLLGDPNSDYINANYIDVSQQSHTVFSQTHKHSHCFCYYVASLEFIRYMWTLSLSLAILYVAYHHISFDRKLFRPLAVLFVMGETFGYSFPGISDLPKDFRAWSDVKRSLIKCFGVILCPICPLIKRQVGTDGQPTLTSLTLLFKACTRLDRTTFSSWDPLHLCA